MNTEQWFQCQSCGHVHKVNTRFDIENNLFVKMECERCRDDTSHIWVGEDPADTYIYYNANLDYRYYKYNTK